MPNELNWEEAEDEVWDWISSALGSMELRWTGQDVPQAETDYAILSIPTVIPIGAPQENILYDPLRDPQGQGVELRAGGPAEVNLTVSVSTAEAQGQTSAVARLARARTILTAETVERAALREAGVTVSRLGPVLGIPVLVGADFQGRAALEIRLFVQDFYSTFTTWIEQVQLETHVT